MTFRPTIVSGGQPISNWPGYYVTRDGAVWTTRSNSGACDKPPRKMKPAANRTGHLKVRLSNYGKSRMTYVHRLVLEAFVGPCPKGLVARHLNGVPDDNRLKNLRWGTSSRNRMDMWDHGTMPHGEELHSSKLTESQVLSIRERYTKGENNKAALAREYEVDARTIRAAVRGEWWKHVGGPLSEIDGGAFRNAKLNHKTAAEIRRRYARGAVTYKQLATMFGVSTYPIYRIINERAWV